MEERDKLKLVQLNNKIEVLSKMKLSDSEIEKSFDKDELDLIEKARVHKYIRKEGDKYIYDEPKEENSDNKDEKKSNFRDFGDVDENFISNLEKFGNSKHYRINLISGLKEALFRFEKRGDIDNEKKAKNKIKAAEEHFKKNGL